MDEISKLLTIGVNNINNDNRQFGLFGYNTIFHDTPFSKFKRNDIQVSKERAIFPI